MATPRQKVQVGIFLSVCGALLVGTIVVLSGLQQEKALPYTIEFDESVSGLNVGSDLRYRGVLVGRVTELYVAPNTRIGVTVEVRPSVLRIRPGMTAQLAAAGITGQLYINLSGGNPEGEPLPSGATIPTIPSLLTNITTALPNLLASMNGILLRIERILGEDGQITTVLQSLEDILGSEGQITSVLQAAQKLLSNLDTTLVGFANRAAGVLERTEPVLHQALSGSTQSLQRLERHVAALDPKGVGTRLQNTLLHLGQLAERLGRTNDELVLALQSTRGDVSNIEFHFRQAVRSWRETLLSAKQFFDFLERDPTALLIGKRVPTRTRDGSQR